MIFFKWDVRGVLCNSTFQRQQYSIRKLGNLSQALDPQSLCRSVHGILHNCIIFLWRFSFIQVMVIHEGVESGITGLGYRFSKKFHIPSKRLLQGKSRDYSSDFPMDQHNTSWNNSSFITLVFCIMAAVRWLICCVIWAMKWLQTKMDITSPLSPAEKNEAKKSWIWVLPSCACDVIWSQQKHFKKKRNRFSEEA